MNRWRDILLLLLVGLQILWAVHFFRKVRPGPPANVLDEIGKPYAVLTIDYGENPEKFEEGGFYVLKVLKIRGTKIDYGFCPIRRNEFYDAD